MLAYDQTLIIIDSVGCAFLRWQGESKQVGERFVGGGPGTGNVRPFVALLPTCVAQGLRVSCTV